MRGRSLDSFYNDFKYFLPKDFVMNKRVKRPPDNPINALVSFGNTLLYTKQFQRFIKHIWIKELVFYMNRQKDDFH